MKPAKPRRVCLASSATLKADVRQEENEMIRSGPISKANRIAAWILAAIRTAITMSSYALSNPPSEPFIRKRFKKIDTTFQVGRVSEALKQVLEAEPDIRTVNWTSEAYS